MKHTFQPRLFKRWIMTSFCTEVEGEPHQRFEETYYKDIYFIRLLFGGMKFLATCKRKSKKKMANELMALGIRRFMEEKSKEFNKRVIYD